MIFEPGKKLQSIQPYILNMNTEWKSDGTGFKVLVGQVIDKSEKGLTMYLDN